MTGLIFSYFAGYLRVDFRHMHSRGDIEIIFQIHGDTTATMTRDAEFSTSEQMVHVEPDVVLRCWTSDTTSQFFRNMVSWLEAVICDVAECAFFWEGEGPDGELRWYRGHEGAGRLKLRWTGRRDSLPFDHEVTLESSQMVQALYQSFRRFVESDRYDPIAYESLLYGEVCDLIAVEGRKALAQEIAHLDRFGAYSLIVGVEEFAYDRDTDSGSKRFASMEELVRLAEIFKDSVSSDDELRVSHMEQLLPEFWNGWSIEQRQRHVEDEIFFLRGYGGFGEKLREMRSPKLEAWLLKQATIGKIS